VNRYDYHKPGTLEEAVGLMATLDGAKYIAGALTLWSSSDKRN
jgi:CO/xanthine dehydrogenase FAD-binding subunit